MRLKFNTVLMTRSICSTCIKICIYTYIYISQLKYKYPWFTCKLGTRNDNKVSCKDVRFGFLWRSPWLQSSGTWRRVVSQITKMFWKNPLCSSAGYPNTGAVHSSETSVIFYTTMLHILDRYSSDSRTCGCCTIVQDSDWLIRMDGTLYASSI